MGHTNNVTADFIFVHILRGGKEMRHLNVLIDQLATHLLNYLDPHLTKFAKHSFGFTDDNFDTPSASY